MADLLFISITVGFFALAALFVRGCDKIIGAGDEASAASPASEPERTIGADEKVDA